MRCKNCGWENQEGTTRCVKCGSALEQGNSSVGNMTGTVVESAAASAAPAVGLNKTVCEAAPFSAPASPATSAAPQECPACGYPLRGDAQACPNCKNVFNEEPRRVANQQQAPQENKPFQNIPEENNSKPLQNERIMEQKKFNGTINPYIKVTPVNKCSLTPIAQPDVDSPAPLKLKGDAHNLNRACLDPDNPTITSRVQAQLVCEDGQWSIVDKSDQHTTFIHVGKKTPLKDGDVILMGNRQFVFHVEK